MDCTNQQRRQRICPSARVSNAKRFVYILRSESHHERYYTGLTADVAQRVAAHNRGGCSHTVNGRPWKVVVAIEFADQQRAIDFERYLKSGSGCAFAKRHFR